MFSPNNQYVCSVVHLGQCKGRQRICRTVNRRVSSLSNRHAVLFFDKERFPVSADSVEISSGDIEF